MIRKTAAHLRSHTAKDLAQMARKNGVSGWHSMRKEELIASLIQHSCKRPANANKKRKRSATKNPSETRADSQHPRSRSKSSVQKKIDRLQRKLASVKSLSNTRDASDTETSQGDRLAVMVRDPYWLHAFWEISERSIHRAQVAMGQRWHAATPVLRLFQVKDDGVQLQVRDIAIHGGVSNWYVDVPDPPNQFRMEIGYLATDKSFHCLARSNTVTTPPASSSDAVDENWADVAENADRIFAMSGGYSASGTSRELKELLEQRLRRPLGTPMKTRFGNVASNLARREEMPFAVDAEIVVYGAADRDAHVTLKGEPVPLREDGTFAVRVSLPDKRQVIPVVASSADGVEQRTIILAVERNTKVMERVMRDITGK